MKLNLWGAKDVNGTAKQIFSKPRLLPTLITNDVSKVLFLSNHKVGNGIITLQALCREKPVVLTLTFETNS